MTTPRRLLEAALEAARTTQAAAGTTIAIIQSQLASLDQEAECGTKIYTLEQAAERRNLSANTLRSWARSGRLACRRGPREAYLVTDADIDAALAVLPSASPQPPTPKLELVEDIESFDALEATLRTGRLRVKR